MPLTLPYPNFVPLTTIYSSQVNADNSAIKLWADAHEIAPTGVHGVGTGIVVGTANNNSFTAQNNFVGPTFINQPNFISNARLILNAGILTLGSVSGAAAPSPTHPVYFTYPTSDGSWQQISFTSSTYCTIRDTTAGTDLNGINLGTTAGVAWADTMPLFIYLVTDGVNPCLFLSRFPFPQNEESPTSSSLGYQGTAPASNLARNMIGWTANNITVSHASQTAILIGFLHATKNAANAWTFSSAAGSYGIGNLNKIFSSNYNFPTGQNGAAAGSYFSAGGGTLPTYTASFTYTYRITNDGRVNCSLQFSNAAGGTAGAGPVQLQLLLPIPSTVSSFRAPNQLYVTNNVSAVRCQANIVGNFCQISYNAQTALGTGISNYTSGLINNDDQNNATRGIVGNIIYNLY